MRPLFLLVAVSVAACGQVVAVTPIDTADDAGNRAAAVDAPTDHEAIGASDSGIGTSDTGPNSALDASTDAVVTDAALDTGAVTDGTVTDGASTDAATDSGRPCVTLIRIPASPYTDVRAEYQLSANTSQSVPYYCPNRTEVVKCAYALKPPNNGLVYYPPRGACRVAVPTGCQACTGQTTEW
jgi:hypothetical protein